MTAKNRQKNSAAPAAPPAAAEDAPKKSQKSGGANGLSGTAAAAQSSRSGGWLSAAASAVFYLAFLGAAGFAAFYLQQVVEEVRHTAAGREESARHSAQLGAQIHAVAQQVESLRGVVDGLESSLGITRVELEGAVGRVKRGEADTRKVEETLQKLQNDLLRELSDGISEVKEARERDFSSLETTVEERLAEVSRSIQASVSGFAQAQGDTQGQLDELKAHLSDAEDPALLKQELTAITDAVAEIKAAKEASDGAADLLRAQIGSVREELQTRNQEVASLSQEIQSVRVVMQEAVGGLRQSLAAAESGVKEAKDRSAALEGELRQTADAVQSAEREAREAAAQAQKRSEELEARVRAAEEAGDSTAASVSDVTEKVEALLAKYDVHESTLAAQGEAAEKARDGLRQLEALRAELQATAALRDYMEALETRLAAVEEGGQRVPPEQVETLRGAVAGLEGRTARLEAHEAAIAAMQKTLQETTKTLAGMAKAPGKKK